MDPGHTDEVESTVLHMIRQIRAIAHTHRYSQHSRNAQPIQNVPKNPNCGYEFIPKPHQTQPYQHNLTTKAPYLNLDLSMAPADVTLPPSTCRLRRRRHIAPVDIAPRRRHIAPVDVAGNVTLPTSSSPPHIAQKIPMAKLSLLQRPTCQSPCPAAPPARPAPRRSDPPPSF